MTLSTPYEILVGAGEVWYAPVGETYPLIDAAPAGNWALLGETDGGVQLIFREATTNHRTDHVTGPIKVTRQEEEVVVQASIAEATLEAIGAILGQTVVTTAPGGGAAGIREVPLKRSVLMNELAFLFRGDSPYEPESGVGTAPYPAQYELPRGYLGGEIGSSFTKDGKTLYPYEFIVLEDFDQATAAEQFGRLVAQDLDSQP